MSYDDMFTVADPSAETTTVLPAPPPRREPPYGLILLGLAVVCALLVCIPVTRLAGIILATLLVVPAVVVRLREQRVADPGGQGWGPPNAASASRWASTSALAVLGVALVAGLTVGLLTGEGFRLTSTGPDAGTAPTADSGDFVGPTAAPSPPAAPVPAPVSAVPRVTPTPAAPRPRHPAAGTPRPSRSASPSESASESSDSSDSGRHNGEHRDRRDREDKPSKEPDRSCNFGAVRTSPLGGYEVCTQPDGQGGYTWRHADERDIPE